MEQKTAKWIGECQKKWQKVPFYFDERQVNVTLGLTFTLYFFILA